MSLHADTMNIYIFVDIVFHYVFELAQRDGWVVREEVLSWFKPADNLSDVLDEELDLYMVCFNFFCGIPTSINVSIVSFVG